MKYNYLTINRFFISILPISLIFSIFISDLIVSISSLCFLIFIYKEKKSSLLKTMDFKIFLIFYLIFIISALNSDFVQYSLYKTLPYLRFGIFIILMKYLFINDDKIQKYLLYSITVSFLILILGIILQFSDIEYISKHINGSRFSSFFLDELILGSYLVKILPLFLALIVFLNHKKYLYISIFAFMFLILLSGERSALISLIFFLSFLFLFTKIINNFNKIVIVFIIVLIFFSILNLFPKTKFRLINQTAYQLSLIEPEKDYVEFEIEKNKYIAVAREEYFIPLKYYLMFESAIKIYKDNLYFGSGIKTFKILCKDERYFNKKNYLAFKDKPDDYYEGFTGVDSCSTHPHNYYIQLLAETGIFSFLLVCLLFIYFGYKFFKEEEMHLKILYLSLMVNLFPFYFTGNFFNNFISIMLYLNISFLSLNKTHK